jgi:hypothetical protein
MALDGSLMQRLHARQLAIGHVVGLETDVGIEMLDALAQLGLAECQHLDHGVLVVSHRRNPDGAATPKALEDRHGHSRRS